MSATLYIVSTPIGNLDDISHRAIKVLNQVNLIAAEDTRHSARLLQHYAINTPMQAYHEFGGDAQTETLFRYLAQGKSIALISDAGTPLISDPGYRLVARAHREGVQVVPVPGACALVAALSASGLATDSFCFEGFMPAKSKARRDRLQALIHEDRTLIFYEAPHRVLECLQDMCELLGADRRISLARELTKTYETILQTTLAGMCEWVAADSNQRRGEIVLVVEGARPQERTELDDKARQLVALLLSEMPPRKACKIVADWCGIPKKTVYDYILSLKK